MTQYAFGAGDIDRIVGLDDDGDGDAPASRDPHDDGPTLFVPPPALRSLVVAARNDVAPEPLSESTESDTAFEAAFKAALSDVPSSDADSSDTDSSDTDSSDTDSSEAPSSEPTVCVPLASEDRAAPAAPVEVPPPSTRRAHPVAVAQLADVAEPDVFSATTRRSPAIIVVESDGKTKHLAVAIWALTAVLFLWLAWLVASSVTSS